MGKNFSDRLKELRDEAGLTQTELGEKAGLSRGGIAQLEAGIRAPAWDTVQALAKALGVDCTAFQETAPPARKRGRPKK